MSSTWRQSDMFRNNYVFWKVFGIWSGRKPNKNYKYYSIFFISIFTLIYNLILTLNLLHTPAKIENLIREVIFYFTEIGVTSKVFMIVIMRDKILEAFSLIDGKDLEGDDEITKNIIEKHSAFFMKAWKFWALGCHCAFSSQVLVPIILHFVFNADLVLPISEYYFFTDEIRETYFIYLFIYQSVGIYGHMIYDMTINSFVCGLLLMAIAHVKVLNVKLMNLKIDVEDKKLSYDEQEKIQVLKLRRLLRRYEVVLEYCDVIQEVLSLSLFVLFGISSFIICVVMCGLLLIPLKVESFLFLALFLVAMLMQIFIPGYLGTLLTYESSKLVFAAYCTEWIPRSESFKRSLRLFVERANKPILITGLNMLPLSLATFTSIVKTAYSFFALIRSFQE